ncbi:hypothetical protein CH063_00956 [Colletotrichum higginsianum]|uniref:Infection structure specific protein n=2 Tax=Colletotrichum higginsianum TaxID=80884 RepID=H1UZF0_COLHI|nr:Infection structure specific protein [Colletotrichum higginsianum IMI 349063]OBR02662.1 Infection structure specific protein [Colletotrichum higginsianum IMI 349063]TID07296.1 hypothetical protein CH35J_000385 [Colletotrichum higginsianum]CCF33351.1 hypothetical protein CH063_00956 [Colletotrichum higginsianum]
MQSKLLIVAAVATGAVAIRDLSGTFPQNFRRGADALEARDEAACFSVVAEHATLTADFPELPTALATATDVEIPQITDPCQFPSVTGSAGQLVTSYSSALQSWQDAHITEIRSLWSACSDVPQISSLLDEYGNGICSTALAPITANGTAATTATATATVTGEVTVTTTGDATGATASGDAASTTASPAAAAPRETGLFLAAAAAAAGFVGAAML